MYNFTISKDDERFYNSDRTKYYKIQCKEILRKLSNLKKILSLRCTHSVDNFEGQEIILSIDLIDWWNDRILLNADNDKNGKPIKKNMLYDYTNIILNNLDKLLFDNDDIFGFEAYKKYDNIYKLEYFQIKIEKYTKIQNYSIFADIKLKMYELNENQENKPYENYVNPWTIDEVNKILNLIKDIKKLNVMIDDE